MVLVLVLSDVLVVPYPLPLGFGDAFYLFYPVVVECDCFPRLLEVCVAGALLLDGLLIRRPRDPRSDGMLQILAVAEYGNPSNGSKHTSNLLSLTWFSLNVGQKTWEGRVDPPRAVTPQGELDPLVQLGRELETEGLLSEGAGASGNS